MRALVAILVVASGCEASSPEIAVDAANTVDADVCMAAPPGVPGDCLANGLANIDLDGYWTLTGTRDNGTGGAQPYSVGVVLCRSATGWCQCDAPPGSYYVDDTYLYSSTAEPRSSSTHYICVRPADGMLVYHQFDSYSMGGNQTYVVIDGVLTR